MPISLDEARRLLTQPGGTPIVHLGSGMEGHVFDIGDEKVAKVWYSRKPVEITQLRTFYEILNGLHLPFGAPFITEVQDLCGTTVSIERALPGTPMKDLVSDDEKVPPRFATDAVISVLTALRDNPVRDVRCFLPILGIDPSDKAESDGYPRVLLEVASRKVERYGDQLRRSVRDFDWVHERTVERVSHRSGSGLHVIHGDLCPPNILLSPDLKVTAVVDWGFLSLFGDPSLDASIACGIYNMYGEHHREIDDVLMSECVNRMGYDRHTLLVYRALYAMLTSNSYSEDGSDGHYAWCVNTLNRDDVRDALSHVPE